MNSGSVVVALLSKGAAVVQYRDTEKSRVTVNVGKNRIARIPRKRILLTTEYIPENQNQMDEFRQNCERLASETDLSDVWNLLVQEGSESITSESLAELYWGAQVDVMQRVATELYLDQNTQHFVRTADGYQVRTIDAVEEIRKRHRRKIEYASDAASLVDSLSEFHLPEQLTKYQRDQLNKLREYAIHGNDSDRAHSARDILLLLPHQSRDLQRVCFDLLTASGVFKPDEAIELIKAEIPVTHTSDSILEAQTLLSNEPKFPHVNDLTKLNTFTIDNEDTIDRDDALSFNPLTDENADQIAIHIAYAGMLIPANGPIDQSASHRMSSLYLPDQRIDMLPEIFSTEIASLDPGKTRFTLSLTAAVSKSGELLRWNINVSKVLTDDSLTYEQATHILDKKSHPSHITLDGLRKTADSIRTKREQLGAIVLDQPEMTIKIDSEGQVDVRVIHRDNPARLLVSEMAILYNSIIAEFCKAEGIPALYRVQPSPEISDINTDISNEQLKRYQLTKRLLPAELKSTPDSHGSLGVSAYVQATSPLRRYPDMIMQRQVASYISTGSPFYTQEEINSILHRAEIQMRDIARLEESRKRYWFLKFLSNKVLENPSDSKAPKLFNATILENEPHRRTLLELNDYPFRFRAEIPSHVHAGESVTLQLQAVDLWQRIASFVYVQTDR